MRRLPNTYPGNLTKYPNGRGTISIGSADAGSKVLFYNETPVNLDLDFYNGDTDVLHAWEANFWYLDGEVSDITWAIDADSLNVVNPPINAVFATIYNPNERLNDKAYPMPLIRQIGGQQAIVSSASSVVNDGNTLLQVIEATLQGHGSSDVIINNDGSFTLKGAGLIGAVGILEHILGPLTVDGILTAPAANVLGAVGVLQHILGTLTVDQASTLTGVVTAPAANSLGTVGNNQSILGNATIGGTLGVTGNVTHSGDTFLVNKKLSTAASGDLADWSGAGLFIKGNPSSHGKCNYQGDGSHTDWSLAFIGNSFTGTGAGTFSHGCLQFNAAVAPTDFIHNPCTAAGSSNELGMGSITTTQVTVSSINAVAWKIQGMST